ncbi:hypothetical protein [Brenneria tiliae]|uniref:hypothetical protein n=1 Tax=Brenneria tiliae TaxID=2914984 RepID=UPI0020149EFA|nr:hypothetical protein [Brenneria tiliae]MCL2897306.1 hypothetical protein [Brenneria tiliae]MCL2901751.1 hypothetical protein [Brenneria tiliae]
MTEGAGIRRAFPASLARVLGVIPTQAGICSSSGVAIGKVPACAGMTEGAGIRRAFPASLARVLGVIPAQAGICSSSGVAIGKVPACAGMTMKSIPSSLR